MLIVMDRSATPADVDRVVETAERLGLKAHPIPGEQRTAVGITGNKGTIEPAAFENLPGVLEVIRVSHPYKLVSREFHPEDTVVSIGGVPVGGTRLAVIAGRAPSSRSSRRSRSRGRSRSAGRRPPARRGLQAADLPLLVPGARRGGAEDPRRGARGDGPSRRDRGRSTPSSIDLVAPYADCLQIGARNMQNFELLKAAGRIGQAGPPQARHVGHARGVPPRRRVRPRRGEPERRPLRAGRPDLQRLHAQHARPLRRPGRRAPLAPADHRRPVARDRAAATR